MRRRVVHVLAVQVVASSCRRRSVSSHACLERVERLAATPLARVSLAACASARSSSVLRSPLRGSRHVPGPGVVGDVLPGPARSTPCASAGRRAVTAFRHAPCMAAPVAPLRCVVGGATAPGRDRPSAAVLPRATVIPPRYALVTACAQEDAQAAPSSPLAPSDSAPAWTAGLAMCGAGPRLS